MEEILHHDYRTDREDWIKIFRHKNILTLKSKQRGEEKLYVIGLTELMLLLEEDKRME